MTSLLPPRVNASSGGHVEDHNELRSQVRALTIAVELLVIAVLALALAVVGQL